MTEESKKKVHKRSDKSPKKTSMKEQDPKEAIKNYLEVPFGYTEEETLPSSSIDANMRLMAKFIWYMPTPNIPGIMSLATLRTAGLANERPGLNRMPRRQRNGI